ncbi:MAG: adenylate/guanylate cyclase domain-containing protein [Burkholderiaceae bacterium]|nr:adenylate/guanylate cyclase domain-containing protein [Burkholderiaceae bacterium]
MRKLLAKHGARWAVGLALTLIVSAHALFFPPNRIVERLDIFIGDLRVNSNAQHPQIDPRVVIVDIDEKSLIEVGRFPWSRNVQADLVRELTQHYQVRAAGFDIDFPEPDTTSGYLTLEALAQTDFKGVPDFGEKLKLLKPKLDYDELMAEALKDQPVVLGYSLSLKQKKGVLPPPAFRQSDLGGLELHALAYTGYEANIAKLQGAARSGGFFNTEIDSDGVLRSSPLIAKVGDGYYESLALATTRVALGATATMPLFLPPSAFANDKARREYGVLDKLVLNTQPVRRIPVEDGLKVRIDYRGRGGVDGGGFKYVSATDVLHERVPVEELARRIVLVGTSVPGLNDLRAAPMNSEFPGVEAHANMVASILDGHFKQVIPDSDSFNLVQIVFVGLALTFALSLLRPVSSIISTMVVLTGLLWLNFWFYQSAGWILPVAAALLLAVTLFVINIAWGYLFEYRKGRAMTNLFGEYVAPELVEVMSSDPEHYNMEGEVRELTILFCDVRGFTTISEGLEPNALREYINLYLTAMSEDIRGNRGTLDKYIGDAVMAFWGAPVTLPNHAGLGVTTALLMHKSAEKLNADFTARGWPPLKIGIGLNTGEVRVGDMGSKIRRAYTVMGDAVNLASRLEGITKEYGVGVVVGEGTKAAAPDFAYRELDRVRVKGKNEPVAIFEPVKLQSELSEDERRVLSRWHAALKSFRAQKWDEAELTILSLQKADPERKLYKRYLDSIADLRADPPGAEWDGVTTFKTK